MHEYSSSSEANLPAPSSLHLAGQALTLNDRAYDAISTHPSPARRGLTALLIILGVLILAQALGLLLGTLTQPNLSSLQAFLYDTIIGLPWYAQQSAASPGFATQFEQSYAVAWDGLRTLLGFRTLPGVLGSAIGLVISTLALWFLFSLIAYGLARWFGSRARFGAVLGASALALSPLLLTAVQAIPGAVAPFGLIALALLVTQFQAIKRVTGLSSGHSLAVVLGVFVIGGVLLFGVLLFGLALGLQQIPYLDQALKLAPLPLPR